MGTPAGWGGGLTPFLFYIKMCDVTAYILWKNACAKLPDYHDRAGLISSVRLHLPSSLTFPLTSFTPLERRPRLLKLRGHIEFIKPEIGPRTRLIWKRVIYMGIFDSWRAGRGEVANWRRAAGSAGSLGTALPSRFATTFSHAVSISIQVERHKSVSRVFGLSPQNSELQQGEWITVFS